MRSPHTLSTHTLFLSPMSFPYICVYRFSHTPIFYMNPHDAFPPHSQVLESGETSKYIVYNIHVNGTYHCSARFSRLRDLYIMLKREFGVGAVGEFPSKTLFYVKKEDTARRRVMIEKFFQNVARVPAIVNGSTFQNFLLNAQSEIQRNPEEDVQLDILLPNGKSIVIDIISTHQADDVLETVCLIPSILLFSQAPSAFWFPGTLVLSTFLSLMLMLMLMLSFLFYSCDARNTLSSSYLSSVLTPSLPHLLREHVQSPSFFSFISRF